jgi:hypothetical protein
MKMKKLLLVLPFVVLPFVVILVASCASGEKYGEVSDRIPPVSEGLGRIFFYRPSAMAGGLKPQIRVNDIAVGKSISKGFLFIDREPGQYTVATSTLMEHSQSFSLAAGETCYVKLRSSVGLVAGHILPGLVTEEEARRELAGMKYIGDPSLLSAP